MILHLFTSSILFWLGSFAQTTEEIKTLKLPEIKYWSQVTVNSVKICWTLPNDNNDIDDDSYDFFRVGVERLRNPDSLVKFEKEEFVKDMTKVQRCTILWLTQGAHYRVNVTTAVGTEDNRMFSAVQPPINSVQFKTWHRFYDHFVFPRLQWTFSTCGKSGRFGPSQLLCDGYYSDTNLNQLVDVRDGVQHWAVPIDGLYQITAAGAGYEGQGGLGAVVSGQFYLKEGISLKIAVGQRGRSISLQNEVMVDGGGGGTFVMIDHSENEDEFTRRNTDILLIAGGAGSGPVSREIIAEAGGRLNYQAGNGSEVGPGFGLGGVVGGQINVSGLPGLIGTGGGAGFKGIATFPTLSTDDDVAFPAMGLILSLKNEQLNEEENQYAPLSGGRYQTALNSVSEGGFGGGGCGYLTGVGGGGGYSGGGGGPIGGFSGGGGSYIKATGGKEKGEVTNNQPGYVSITVVGLSLVSPIPLTFYLVVSFVAGIGLALICGAGLYGVHKYADKYFRTVELAKITAKSKSFDETASNLQRNRAAVEISNPQSSGLSHASDTSFSSGEDTEIEGTYEVHENKRIYSRNSGIAPHIDSRYPERSASQSVSSVSSVSSMQSGINEKKFALDLNTGKLKYRGRNSSYANSSFTGFETSASSEMENEVNDKFSPTSPLPAPELASEEQKQEFRKKYNMFHNLAERSASDGRRIANKSIFLPSTNL